MTDTVLFNLVKDWTKTLSYQSAFDVTCKIAKHLQLPEPKNDTDSLGIMFHVSKNYPSLYSEATKSFRKSRSKR